MTGEPEINLAKIPVLLRQMILTDSYLSVMHRASERIDENSD